MTRAPCLALLLALLLAGAGRAAPAQADPPHDGRITYGSRCGERATGYIARGDRLAGDGLLYSRAVPGQRVDERGVWVPCTPDPVSQPCRTQEFRPAWSAGDVSCQATRPIARGVYPHGSTEIRVAVRDGRYAGHILLQCQDGQMRVARAVCR